MTGPKSRPLADRFWEKVNKNGPIPTHRPELGRCWLWTASKYPPGYGQIGITRSRSTQAHRVSWELNVGPIPAGMEIDHLCRNKSCVRPPHLEVVTPAVNTKRAPASRSTENTKKTTCPNGHPYDAVRIRDGKPNRYCRRCRNEGRRVGK